MPSIVHAGWCFHWFVWIFLLDTKK